MTSTFSLATPDSLRIAALSKSLGVAPVLASLLLNRGMGDREAAGGFLARSAHDLLDPMLLPGMGAACARLKRAIEQGEQILVHGDYDVDGVTGSVLLVRLLRLLGAKAAWHIPNRLVDGYSFGPHSLVAARAAGASVVISVDNGTSAHETIAELKRAGIDTIVTDHHEPPELLGRAGPLPDAVAIVNPKLPGSTYPWRELCGGAVAFKLAWGLCKQLAGSERVGSRERRFLEEALAYAAIATVCDVVPLLNENRGLVHIGLKSLRAGLTPGLRALLEISGLKGRALNAEDVAFQIGPRINASGRLGSAECAVECLLAEDDGSALRHATQLDEINRERKRIEALVLIEARKQAAPFADRSLHPLLVIGGQGWHQGVVGIVAARLVEEYKRPVLVIGFQGPTGRGSARSVAGFNVLEAMHAAAPHFERYGGHEQAAGCDLRSERLEAVREAMCAAIQGRHLERPSAPAKAIDCELPLFQLTTALMQQIDRLEPFGAGNQKPIFLARDARVVEAPRLCGADRRHVMLRLRSAERQFKGMGFGLSDQAPAFAPGRPIEVVYSPRWNSFRGETQLELLVHGLYNQAAGSALTARPAPEAAQTPAETVPMG